MLSMALCIFAAICFALLLAALFWPARKRKDVPRQTVHTPAPRRPIS